MRDILTRCLYVVIVSVQLAGVLLVLDMTYAIGAQEQQEGV